MTTQFYNDVLKFLHSTYSENYKFNINVTKGLLGEDTAELVVEAGNGLVIKASNVYMKYIFNEYESERFLQERKIFSWQKELIDITEGG